ncbi:acetyltransferase [Trichoderma harzianum]|uniref:Acetyltransferase n=1 Tax=Trichoderma harzianum TaxID=5544 RepID=A0A0G0AS50_TRIHA|nr:acetyltransferase [Trichoderma harzianum]
MATYTLAPVSLSDSEDLSRNNISAFWQDPNWVLAWKHSTLEKQIDITTKRYPRRLISDHATARHQKAIDPQTGRLVGYARWVLPDSYATTADGEPTWPEALGPVVSPEEAEEIKRIAEATPLNANNETDHLDNNVTKMKNEVLEGKTYFVLEYLAVHPENQGKGIATLLVQSGMKEAEKLGLDIFVLAFRYGWGVYGRLGFSVERELIQDDSMYGGDGKYGVRCMIYKQPPKTEV